jgi:hypothetical protein
MSRLLRGLALVVLALPACGDTSSSSSETTRVSPVSLAALAPELVGTWETYTSLDSSGTQQIRRTFQFAPDGRYEYTLGVCRSSSDCDLQVEESGYAQSANGILTLAPETESSEGPRAWPYVVDRDPVVGDVRLNLTLPDGQIDIFYVP